MAAMLILILALGLGLSLSFWPGIMIWDSGRQYAQALSGHFDDWHPPLMEWIWRFFIPLMPGPGPMLVLQLGIYAAALGFLAWRSWRQGRASQAVWLAATGLFAPIWLLMATVIKDSLMAAMLLAAFGLLACARDSGNRLARITATLLILVASALRFNAFLAGLPLLLLAMPENWTRHRARAALAVAGACAALVLAMPIANRLLHAERSGVELSLVIFDLGGITAHGGGDVFPPLPVAHPAAVARGCYLAERWDSYSWWVDPPCAIRFGLVRSAFDTQHINPEIFWIKAILSHPIAYARHRLAHWNIASQFLVRKPGERWIIAASDPNDWGFRVAPNPVNRFVTAAAWAVNATPLGWPCWWLALAFALVVLGHHCRLVLALAGSALLYDLGYGVFSVASELRYYCWPMMASLVAAVLLAGAWRPPGRMQLVLAAVPLAAVTLLGLGWRLL